MDRLAQRTIQDRIQMNTDRAAYNYASSLKGKPDPLSNVVINPAANITEGYLRCELDGANREEYRFRVKENQGEENVTEQRLKISDVFLVTRIGLQMYVTGDGEDATRASALLQSYASIALNAAAAAASVQAVWNGSLEIRVDDIVYFDALDTLRMYRAGTAQLGVEVSNGGTNVAYVADEWDDDEWSYTRLTPFIFLGGRSNNEVNLSLPTAVDLTGVTLVWQARGLQIQNAFTN